MKYVISDQDEFAVGDDCFHTELAAGFLGKVIAAGHFKTDNEHILVFGKSTGLNIESKTEDAEHLKRLMEKHGN